MILIAGFPRLPRKYPQNRAFNLAIRGPSVPQALSQQMSLFRDLSAKFVDAILLE